jgi:apolipoprotein N-acyltransferase
MIGAPIVWVALEHMRAYVLTGFPWYYLAHSQHSALAVIQIADLTGSLGVSLLIALVNAWLVDVLTLPLFHPTPHGPRLVVAQKARLVVTLSALIGVLGYGGFRLGTAHFRNGPRVALLQSSLIQRYKQSRDNESILAIYRGLIERALNGPHRPDLIIWPETSYPYHFTVIDEAVDDDRLAKQLERIGSKLTAKYWRWRTQQIATQLRGWADSSGIPMVVGTLVYDHRASGLSKYNSAVLFEPRIGAEQLYHKHHLVPFGEYVPLIALFPWLTIFTPYQGANAYVPSLDSGHEPAALRLGPYRLATAICFEDTVPRVVRRFFAGIPGDREPDALLNLSNDGWFPGSSEQDMHLAISVFRAVEHRVPLVRAANTGVSAIVDGNGRVLEMLAKLKEGVVSGIVPLDDRTSCYSVWGDWLGLGCTAVTIGLIPLGIVPPEMRRKALRHIT